MTWQDLLNAQRVRAHRTGPQEIFDLRGVVERDLKDAKLDALSDDRRFATAYNAVLQLTKIVIACEGYRVVGLGHHQTTFQALEIAMGRSVVPLSSYFELCRRQRNQVDYDMANVATEAETRLLVQKAEEFQRLVEDWIRKHYPAYAV
jgi:cobalamin-dependent methionine synthase I